MHALTGVKLLRPDPKRDDTQLLAWVGAIVQREQQNGTYGKVVVHMEKGKIVRVTTEKIELPAFTTPETG